MTRTSIRKPITKHEEAERIRLQREAFLARGGVIEQVPPDVFGDPECGLRKTMRNRIEDDVDQCSRERTA